MTARSRMRCERGGHCRSMRRRSINASPSLPRPNDLLRAGWSSGQRTRVLAGKLPYYSWIMTSGIASRHDQLAATPWTNPARRLWRTLSVGTQRTGRVAPRVDCLVAPSRTRDAQSGQLLSAAPFLLLVKLTSLSHCPSLCSELLLFQNDSTRQSGCTRTLPPEPPSLCEAARVGNGSPTATRLSMPTAGLVSRSARPLRGIPQLLILADRSGPRTVPSSCIAPEAP
jgi:hypothetical protein